MHDADNAIVTREPFRVVGKNQEELDKGRKKVNQSIYCCMDIICDGHRMG